jgi:hypothetical protein
MRNVAKTRMLMIWTAYRVNAICSPVYLCCTVTRLVSSAVALGKVISVSFAIAGSNPLSGIGHGWSSFAGMQDGCNENKMVTAPCRVLP